MKIPDNVTNTTLYKRAYDKVTGIYGQQTSAYRSMAIVTEYKRLGGRYKESKKKNRFANPAWNDGCMNSGSWFDRTHSKVKWFRAALGRDVAMRVVHSYVSQRKPLRRLAKS